MLRVFLMAVLTLTCASAQAEGIIQQVRPREANGVRVGYSISLLTKDGNTVPLDISIALCTPSYIFSQILPAYGYTTDTL